MYDFKLCWTAIHLAPVVTGYILISAFSFLGSILIRITSSEVGIIRKKTKVNNSEKKKKHGKIILLAKSKN